MTGGDDVTGEGRGKVVVGAKSDIWICPDISYALTNNNGYAQICD